jgi:hypothetical protein
VDGAGRSARFADASIFPLEAWSEQQYMQSINSVMHQHKAQPTQTINSVTHQHRLGRESKRYWWWRGVLEVAAGHVPWILSPTPLDSVWHGGVLGAAAVGRSLLCDVISAVTAFMVGVLGTAAVGHSLLCDVISAVTAFTVGVLGAAAVGRSLLFVRDTCEPN